MITELLERKRRVIKIRFLLRIVIHMIGVPKPVIYRATPQWFASISKFRQDILDEVEKVDWLIPWGKHVYII